MIHIFVSSDLYYIWSNFHQETNVHVFFLCTFCTISRLPVWRFFLTKNVPHTMYICTNMYIVAI